LYYIGILEENVITEIKQRTSMRRSNVRDMSLLRGSSPIMNQATPGHLRNARRIKQKAILL